MPPVPANGSPARPMVWGIAAFLLGIAAVLLLLLLSADRADAALLPEPVGNVVERVTGSPAPDPSITDPVEPVVQPIVEPVVAAAEPVVDGVVKPVVDSVVKPVVEPLVDGVVKPLVDSVVKPAVEPVVDGVVKPLVDSVVKPVVEPVVDGVVKPLVDGISEPGSNVGPGLIATPDRGLVPQLAPSQPAPPLSSPLSPSALPEASLAEPQPGPANAGNRPTPPSGTSTANGVTTGDAPPFAPLPASPSPTAPSTSTAPSTAVDWSRLLQLSLFAIAATFAALTLMRGRRVLPFGAVMPRVAFVSAIERPG